MNKILVWGRGIYAKKIFEEQKNLSMLVDYVVDSRCEAGEFYYGKEVIKPEKVDWENVYIIVATKRYFNEIADIILEHGLKYIDEFCDYDYAFRKLISSSKFSAVGIRWRYLHDVIKKYSSWIPDVKQKVFDSEDTYRQILLGQGKIEELVLQCCTERYLTLYDAEIEYDSITDLAIMFEELLINEDYYFESDTDSPNIIDAGANIGLAIYYFKHYYPLCKIQAFEPNVKVREILKRNVERNGWSNIDLYDYALSDDRGEKVFFVQESSMAGSLGKRNLENYDGTLTEEHVRTTILNDFLDKKVNFLKMDIEGEETAVIMKLGQLVQNVEYCFIEFHEGNFKGANSISKILELLEDNGFEVNIAKSYSSGRNTWHRPMLYVGDRISEVIYAKNKFFGQI